MALKTRYAMIGSRTAPLDVKNLMIRVAYSRAKRGCYLGFSGGADMCDEALELGVWTFLIERERTNRARKYLRVFLPKERFNGRTACEENGLIYVREVEAALEHARKFHPNWNALTSDGKKLMARNSFQILGRKLNKPVAETVCWTPDGSLGDKTTSETGGTGQALRIAHANKVPILNIQRHSHRRYLETIVRDVTLPFELTLKQLSQFRGYS